jgi:hypothetical protein
LDGSDCTEFGHEENHISSTMWLIAGEWTQLPSMANALRGLACTLQATNLYNYDMTIAFLAVYCHLGTKTPTFHIVLT